MERLPPEIRLQIFEYLRPFDLIVNKKFYGEAVNVFYANTKFTISIESIIPEPFIIWMESAIPTEIKDVRGKNFLPPPNFDMIQHLQIMILHGCSSDVYEQCSLVRQVVDRLLARAEPLRRLDVFLVTTFQPPETVVSDAHKILEPFRRLRVINNQLDITGIVDPTGNNERFNFTKLNNDFLSQLHKDISSSDPPPGLSPICAVYSSIAAACCT